jgi:hypothetical protein
MLGALVSNSQENLTEQVAAGSNHRMALGYAKAEVSFASSKF